MKRWAFLITVLLACSTVQAQELKPFIRGSHQSIKLSHQGKPFILALWSLDCAHCRDDLELLGSLQERNPKLEVVLVATDTPAQNGEIKSLIKRYRLLRAEAWVFADGFAERLRYEIDPQWYGELPRTYFFGADGNSIAISGKFERDRIERWIRESKING